MDKEKPRKPEALKYGDVFSVSTELAAKPITPKDAAALQSAEKDALGEVPDGAMSSVMSAAAELNQRHGLVQHDQTTNVVDDGRTLVQETTIAGHRVVTESIDGQLLGRFIRPMDEKRGGESKSGD